MDRFDAMQAFARVVEAGSFTKAAQTLHMSKTTVTQLVPQLEARLRVKLLNRTTRQVKVTADGAAYHERVVRLLADLEDADTSLSSAVASPRGRLRVDVPSPLARLILMPALPAFHARYPEIQLHMGVSDRMVGYLRARSGTVAPMGMQPDGERISVQGRHVMAVDDGWRIDAMQISAAFPPNRHVSAKLRAFTDWVVELMAVHAPLASRPGNLPS